MTAHAFVTRFLIIPAGCLMLLGCFGSKPEQEEPTTPPPVVEAAPVQEPAFTTYTVRSGDTLSKISKLHHISVADLCSANGITPKAALKAGQSLKIPGKVEQSRPAAGKPVESAKAEPASKAVEPVASKPASADHSNDPVLRDLNAFAQKCVLEMNRQVVPSKTKKEVVKNPDGTFTCRYIEVDPNSIRASYKKPDTSKAITYVGYLVYDETIYVCKAPTKEAAMAGPFTVSEKSSMTELVKYMKNTWSY